MKASLRIEAIGDDTDQMMRFWTRIIDDQVPGLGTMTFGKPARSYWVAQITGFDMRYKYQRIFLKGKKDYKYANSKGSRGVYVYYLLDSECLYEVKENGKRYFCTVSDDGEIVKIDKEIVDQWVNDHSESTCLTQPGNE